MKQRCCMMVILVSALAVWLGGCSERDDAISVTRDDSGMILAEPGEWDGTISPTRGRRRGVTVEPGEHNDEIDPDKFIADFAEMLDQHENRKRYTSFDQQTLDSIADDDLEQAILDYVEHKVNEDRENEHAIVTRLSKGFIAVYVTFWVEAEVNNGGFNQYFWNSSGQFGLEAIEGFREIGAAACADLMSRAVATAVAEFPEMQKHYERGTLDAFRESYEHTQLDELDTEFYALGEGLSDLRIKYIRSHPHLFYVED